MEFKVGDKVDCLLYGKGVVKVHNDANVCPITVEFENGFYSNYSLLGEMGLYKKRRTLTKGTWKVEEILPEETFERGEVVWFSHNEKIWEIALYVGKKEGYHMVAHDEDLKIHYHVEHVKKFNK